MNNDLVERFNLIESVEGKPVMNVEDYSHPLRLFLIEKDRTAFFCGIDPVVLFTV